MAALRLLAVLLAGPVFAQTGGSTGSPYYTPDSIANAATNTPGPFAPNTFVTIYGENLSFLTGTITPSLIQTGSLPTALPQVGVRVLLDLSPAPLYLVSPNQINFLIPASFTSGRVKLQVVRDAVAGPPVELTIQTSAPGIFTTPDGLAVATHADGSLINADAPARPGEVIVLYAGGLGATSPATPVNRLVNDAAQVARIREFQAWLNGVALDLHRIYYAGVTPGFAGLFQVNLQLPDDTPDDPELRIGYPDQMSPAGTQLIVRAGPPPAGSAGNRR